MHSDEFPIERFENYPFIVDKNGSLSDHANLFVLHEIKSPITPSYRTLECKAYDLCYFFRWCSNTDINYLETNLPRLSRPTYRYHRHLIDLITIGEIAPTTGKRRMSTIIQFYKWLIAQELISDNHSLWIETPTDCLGNSVSKIDLITSFNRFKKQANPENVADESNLRPLNSKELNQLIDSLRKIGNPEMLLSFLLAVCTGARMCTVFTFRSQMFEKELPSTAKFKKIKIGLGSSVKNKKDKQMLVWIPVTLYQQLRIYALSDRALLRRRKFKKKYPLLSPHLFISERGNPYYLSENEAKIYDKLPIRGNTVHQFIAQRLKPKLRENGRNFSFHFHDLRATFALLLLEGLKIENSDNKLEIAAMNYVKSRMGHNSFSTTERYVERMDYPQFENATQLIFEKYLIGI